MCSTLQRLSDFITFPNFDWVLPCCFWWLIQGHQNLHSPSHVQRHVQWIWPSCQHPYRPGSLLHHLYVTQHMYPPTIYKGREAKSHFADWRRWRLEFSDTVCGRKPTTKSHRRQEQKRYFSSQTWCLDWVWVSVLSPHCFACDSLWKSCLYSPKECFCNIQQ